MSSLWSLAKSLSCVLAVVAGYAPARAAEGLPDAFRARIAEGVEAGAWQSVAVGLIHDGTATSDFFGHLEGAEGAPMDAHSRIGLGPLSEAYVGLLFADLVISGKVRLNESLADVLPEGSVFGDVSIGRLTLEQLATFQSGFPLLPPNLFPRNERDPFADYDAVALRSFIAHGSGRRSTGGSVLDVSLLAYALEHRTSGDVAALVRSRVFAELGLDHTGFGDGGLAAGHDFGEVSEPWHYGALTPARGLRSDLEDQLKFAQALLRPGDGPLQAALLFARQSRGDAALGWHVLTVNSDDQEWPLLWNGGSSGGYASFVGLRADRQRAVVLLGNSSTDLSALGLALLSDAAPPPVPTRLRRITNADDYGGLYRFDAKDELIVRADADGLSLQHKGQFPLRFVAYDDDAFMLLGANAQITFQRNSAHRVEGLLLHQGGLNLAASRLSQRAPQLARKAVATERGKLAACVGDFAVGESTQLHLVQQGDGLTWQLTGAAPRALVAFAPHRYASSDGALELRCKADDKGLVDSVVLSLAGGEIEVPRLRWSASGSGAPSSEKVVRQK